MKKQSYNYIICGAGAAGLSLAIRLAQPEYAHLRILILDQYDKKGNDHTWCFWEKEASIYDDLLSNNFSHIYFRSKYTDQKIDIAPYSYKMLQSDRFYEYAMGIIADVPHLTFVNRKVTGIEESDQSVTVHTGDQSYQGEFAFKSFIDYEISREDHLYVDQHFGGWFVRTTDPVFDPNTATFMDFRIDQAGDCRFFYVLPTSTTEALVEIAVFSNEIFTSEAYDLLIQDYLQQFLPLGEFEVTEKEIGVIPMTSYPFWEHNTERVFHIGGAGGAIKPSSGFAFKRIQEHSEEIAHNISSGKNLAEAYKTFQNRFYLYDRVLLDVLLRQGKDGDKIFSFLFGKNAASLVFKFLDGKTSLAEEIGLFTTLPIYPFTRAWVREKVGL